MKNDGSFFFGVKLMFTSTAHAKIKPYSNYKVSANIMGVCRVEEGKEDGGDIFQKFI